MNVSRRSKFLIYVVIVISISAILSQSLYVTEFIQNNTLNKNIVVEKPDCPKKSGYWTENYINVNNNWSATRAMYPWCTGSGTWGNPYVIENVTINAANSRTGCGILIQNNRTAYFVIRNCNITNSANTTYNGGIKLLNTNNGKIIKNNCSYNNWSGISLYNSDNNTIMGNIVDYNINSYAYYGMKSSFGISLYNSDNNTVNLNHVYNNCEDGILVYVSSTGNNITYNNASYNGRSGVMLLNFVTNNWIAHNKLTENGGSVVSLAGIHSESCDGNYLMYNNVSNGKSGAEGINLLQSSNNTIIGNIANDNEGYGIDVNRGSHNNISLNTMNNNLYGIRIYSDVPGASYYCFNNTVSNNTINSNSLDGIRIERSGSGNCFNNTILKNVISDNGLSGIHTSLFIYNTSIINNKIVGNHKHGLDLESATDRSIIINNTITYNQESGIYMQDCQWTLLRGNTVDHNGIHGIHLYYSDNNTIIDNKNSFNNNGFCGFFLENSDGNYLIRNTVKYNQYGIYLNQSNYNQIINNTCEGNNIENLYISEDSIGNYVSQNPDNDGKPGGVPNDDDDSHGDDESISMELTIIIIFLVILGSAVVVSALVVRRVQLKKSSMKGKITLNPKEISTQSSPFKPPQNKTTLALKKDWDNKKLKASWEELGATILTSEEIADLAKTEQEMAVEKQVFTCIVHRGEIFGKKIYLCKQCNTFYCERCAKVLKMKGEKCWTCESEIDIEVTKADLQELTEKKEIESVEGFINERKQLTKK